VPGEEAKSCLPVSDVLEALVVTCGMKPIGAAPGDYEVVVLLETICGWRPTGAASLKLGGGPIKEREPTSK
jgi:hypothetical protein